MSEPECTCDDLTELERYLEEHYDNCPCSTFAPEDAPINEALLHSEIN